MEIQIFKIKIDIEAISDIEDAAAWYKDIPQV
jgi:hypothetical protein